MADTELGELYGTVARPRSGFQAWIGVAGAVTSLALVAGIGVWGYKLAMRDVNGIPVIRALEGPMRIQPKDPGGERMAFQGLAVNEVAADGTAGGISDEVTLAPPEPELLDHDLPQAELVSASIPSLKSATDDAVAAVLDQASEGDSEGDTEIADASVANLAETAQPVVGVIPTSVPGVRTSPRPPPRPQALVLAAAAAEPAPVPKAVEIDADSLPPGSRLVQLGAFETPDLAREAWARVAAKFTDVMAGKERVIQQASAGGQTFFRLRVAGFTDLADARRFCATLAADRANPLCVPVATR